MPVVTAASTPETPELLGGQVGRVGGGERDRDLDRRVVEPLADLGDRPADGQPDGDPTDGAEDEVGAGVQEGEAAADDRGHRGGVEDEGGAVVDQALALDDRDDLARGAVAPGDRGRGDRVGAGRRSRRARTPPPSSSRR